MAIDYAKVITGGVGAWLAFETACDRAGLFSEKYLTAAIGQILAARTGNRVLAEWTHPVLSTLRKGPGRRPEVDFVALNKEGKVELALESKWAGRTLPSTAAILWDLIRLEMIAASTGARCLFVIGGQKRYLEKVFDEPRFADDSGKPHRRPVLRHDTNVLHSVPLVPTVSSRTAILKSLFSQYQDVRFAQKVVTRRTAPYPSEAKPKQYQVYAWEVSSTGTCKYFVPKNSRHYVSSAPSLVDTVIGSNLN